MSIHFPTVHIGGTSRRELSSGLESAYTAVQTALDALSEIRPHGRDYTPVQGHAAYVAALAEADARETSLRVILDELAAMIENVNSQS